MMPLCDYSSGYGGWVYSGLEGVGVGLMGTEGWLD